MYCNVDISQTPRSIRNPVTIHEKFMEQAFISPQSTALIWKNESITYAELNHAADARAEELFSLGVQVGTFVPVILPRSPELIVALLAILKTGAAYTLLDPDWPFYRKQEIIKILNPPLVVVQNTKQLLGDKSWASPHFERVQKDYDPKKIIVDIAVDGNSPACIFFTSGTTGKPKGVISPHRATLRLFQNQSFVRFSKDMVIPLAASLAWDAFSLELWGALLNGGACWVLEEPYLSGEALRRGIEHYSVDTIWMTSSLFNMVVEEDLNAFKGLQQVMIGGERLSVSHVSQFLNRHSDVILINGYGPVESTIFASTHRVTMEDCKRPDGIPIGRPVPGSQIYVVKNDKLCEEGEIGEICIAGEGLALCYLNEPMLTQKKFIELEIKGPRIRLYQTGDLGYWFDKLLHFKGRKDGQIKIRGHRVELVEIENTIKKLPQIQSCRVIASKNPMNNSYELVAFCIPKKKGDQLEDISTLIRSRLAPFMCPSLIVSLESFPLTSQGKLDEKALVKMRSLLSGKSFLKEKNKKHDDELMGIIAEICGQVLNQDFVPEDVSYFDLGGTSLDIGRICARLSSQINFPVPISWLYQYPTLKKLTEQLKKNITYTSPPLTINSDIVPLNSMQRLFLTKYLLNPKDLTSHCLLVWIIKGDLDLNLVQESINYTHQRHEFLRVAYVPDPIPSIRLIEVDAPPLEIFIKQATIERAIALLRVEFSNELDPTVGDIWRAAIIPVSNNVYVFGCVVHHIAFDGWSESILARDLSMAYNSLKVGGLPPSTTHVSVNTILMQQSLSKSNSLGQDEFFIREFSDVKKIVWPRYKENLILTTHNYNEVSILLSADMVDFIDKLATMAEASRFDALLSYWAHILAVLTEQYDFCVGIPVRQRHLPNTEYVIGCYINMVCLRMQGIALTNSVKAIKETHRLVKQALSMQDIPLEHIIQLTNNFSCNESTPLFQTLFALQDNSVPELDLLNLKCKFQRQPYLELPLDLHAEIWPEEKNQLRLAISYRAANVSSTFVQKLADKFTETLIFNLTEKNDLLEKHNVLQ